MKNVKFLTILVAAAIVLTPACAFARTHFSFSLNLMECLQPRFAPVPVIVAPPPPVYYCPPPPPVPYYQHRTFVREYHHHHYICPVQPAPEPYYPYER